MCVLCVVDRSNNAHGNDMTRTETHDRDAKRLCVDAQRLQTLNVCSIGFYSIGVESVHKCVGTNEGVFFYCFLRYNLTRTLSIKRLATRPVWMDVCVCVLWFALGNWK